MTDIDVVSPALKIGIVGAGPSGCYTALAVRRLMPGSEVTVIDSSLIPFGLLRTGIAPDHQGMKGVSRQYERLFAAEGVHFIGGVRVGEHVPISALSAFDGVVLATGLEQDRALDVPIAEHARVLGAGRIIRLLNGDPEYSSDDLRDLGEDLIVYGTGNVALDLLRLIAKTDAELVGSDIIDVARQRLAFDAVRRVVVLGRGARHAARWDAAMLAELCELEDVHIVMDGETLVERPAARVRIDIRFDQQIQHVAAEATTTVVHTTSGLTFSGSALITAVGFVAANSSLACEAEQTLPVVVRTGGPSTGMLGTLAQNRAHGKAAAAELAAALTDRSSTRPGRSGFARALPDGVTAFEDWRLIDHVELLRADAARCRKKLTSNEDIRAALRGDLAIPSSHDHVPA